MKHLVLCRIERRPPRLDLDISYLPKAVVETTRPASYKVLMPGVAETAQVLLPPTSPGSHRSDRCPPSWSESFQAGPAMCGRERTTCLVPAGFASWSSLNAKGA